MSHDEQDVEAINALGFLSHNMQNRREALSIT